MSIKEITIDQLRRMKNQEGLVLQGCGGDLQEWHDGINQMLTATGCLKQDTEFTQVYVFHKENVTCLLFPFTDDVKLDIGKLALWRLASHNAFGGTWLSDYVENQLGGFIREQPVQEEPDCPLIGEDGNIFNLMGIASRTLKENGMNEQAREMRDRIYQCQSYDSALSVIADYVNITSVDEMDQGIDEIRMT